MTSSRQAPPRANIYLRNLRLLRRQVIAQACSQLGDTFHIKFADPRILEDGRRDIDTIRDRGFVVVRPVIEGRRFYGSLWTP